METKGETGMVVRRSITVNRPLEDVYGFWRNLDNLARYSQHLQSVTVDGKRSHWVAHAPAGKTVEWDSELVEDVPNERLAWRSLPGSEIRNEGFITFSSASGDRGTEVRVQMRYDPRPGGRAPPLPGCSARSRNSNSGTICGATSRSWRRVKSSCRMAASRVRARVPGSNARPRRPRGAEAGHEGHLLDGQAERAGPGRPGSADPEPARRDRRGHVDGDLRLGPAPVQRLHADDEEGRHPRPRVHGRGRRGRRAT